MVRKGGFEPPRLSAPPPQDGVSASSTTSALRKLPVLNSLEDPSCEGIPNSTGFCTDFVHAMRSSGRRNFASRANSFPRVYLAHRGPNVIVSRDILQREGVRVPSGLG